MGITLRPDEHYGLIGITGSGKTTWAQRVMIPALRSQRKSHLVIIDIKDEWDAPGVVTVETPVDLNDALYAKERPVSKVIRVRPWNDASQAFAEELLRSAWAPYTRNQRGRRYEPTFAVRVVLDDAAAWYTETGGRGGEDILRRYCTLGRAPQRTLLWCTQRGQIIPKIAVTQASMIICFKMAAYDVSNTIEKQYDKRVANAVRALPRYGYAVVSDELHEGVEIYNPIKGKFPARPPGIDLDNER